jgi:hypothetical protein
MIVHVAYQSDVINTMTMSVAVIAADFGVNLIAPLIALSPIIEQAQKILI